MGKIINSNSERKHYLKKNKLKCKTQKRRNLKRKTQKRRDLKRKTQKRKTLKLKKEIRGGFLPLLAASWFVYQNFHPIVDKLLSCIIYECLSEDSRNMVGEETDFNIKDSFNTFSGLAKNIISIIRKLIIHSNILSVVKLLLSGIKFFIMKKLLDCDPPPINTGNIITCLSNVELPSSITEITDFINSFSSDAVVGDLEDKFKRVYPGVAELLIPFFKNATFLLHFKNIFIQVINNLGVSLLNYIFRKLHSTNKSIVDNLTLSAVYNERYCSVSILGDNEITLAACKSKINRKLEAITEGYRLIRTGWLNKVTENSIIGVVTPTGGVMGLNFREHPNHRDQLYLFLETMGENPFQHIGELHTMLFEENFINEESKDDLSLHEIERVKGLSSNLVARTRHRMSVRSSEVGSSEVGRWDGGVDASVEVEPPQTTDPVIPINLSITHNSTDTGGKVIYYMYNMSIFNISVILKLRYSAVLQISNNIYDKLNSIRNGRPECPYLSRVSKWAGEDAKKGYINTYFSKIISWLGTNETDYLYLLFVTIGISLLLDHVTPDFEGNKETIKNKIHEIEMLNYNDNLTGRYPYSTDISKHVVSYNGFYHIKGWLPLEESKISDYKEHYDHIMLKLLTQPLYNVFITFLENQFHCSGTIEELFTSKYDITIDEMDNTKFILLYVRLLSLLRIFVMYYVTFKGQAQTNIEKAIKNEYKVMYMIALCFKMVESDHSQLDDTLKTNGFFRGLDHHAGSYDIFDAINGNMIYTNFLLEPIFTGSRVTDIHLYSVESRAASSVKLCRSFNVKYLDIQFSIDYDTLLRDMLLGDNGEYKNILI
jgi:hypothetical protein